MGPLNVEDPLYDAFRRHDRYGALGARPQPFLEYVRLAICALIFLPAKFVGALTCVIAVWAIMKVAPLFPKQLRQAWMIGGSKLFARGNLLSSGFVWISFKKLTRAEAGPGGLEPEGPPPDYAAIVSNHVSYLDIVLIVARYFPAFVARANTKDMPFIGPISEGMQCEYVQREFSSKGSETKGVAACVKERMSGIGNGTAPKGTRPLLLFPEGTTTNGRCLLPFKTGAFLAGAPVLPVIIKYDPTDPFSPAWESIDAFWHIFLLLANPIHLVSMTELPVYIPSAAEKADPALYANNVRNYMLRVGDFQPSDASLIDSRAYIALLEGEEPPPHSRAASPWQTGKCHRCPCAPLKSKEHKKHKGQGEADQGRLSRRLFELSREGTSTL
eukprot:jgi/Botrbrau1/3937/Bobra.0365s0012.1